MATLVTPSAKSHERVSGRWVRDIQAESNRDWIIYYAKLIFGTPAPPLLFCFLVSLFVGRTVVEIMAWTTATFFVGYLIVDRFAREREFQFFRIGADLWILGFVVIAFAGLGSASESVDWVRGLAFLRWIPLAYLFAFGWRLFPGLNRMYLVLMSAAALTATYALSQHFTGLDLLRNETLSFAPLKGHSYFEISGFYREPELLGTVFAVLLPLPIAAFTLCNGREKPPLEKTSLALALLLATSVLWTYRPGLWFAAGIGSLITIILQSQRRLLLVAILAVFFTALLFLTYGTPNELTSQIAVSEQARAEDQRAQLGAERQLWTENPWMGAGVFSPSVRTSRSLNGNVYFHLLAQVGGLGLAFYLLFCLRFLQGAYRTWNEIPKTHYWHRVLVSGSIGGLVAFHASGLYWSTLSEPIALALYAFIIGTLGYFCAQYENALVPDDQSL